MLVGLVMVVARVIMCTVPDCYNYGDCGEDRAEVPVPEQFVHTLNDAGKLESKVSELYSS